MKETMGLNMKETMGLCWAACEGDLAEIQRLVASGVDLDEADYDGRTCLHLSAAEGQLEIVKFLLAKNVHLNLKDRWQNTPIDEARGNGHTDIVDLLQSRIGATASQSK
jgi:glutaminase